MNYGDWEKLNIGGRSRKKDGLQFFAGRKETDVPEVSLCSVSGSEVWNCSSWWQIISQIEILLKTGRKFPLTSGVVSRLRGCAEETLQDWFPGIPHVCTYDLGILSQMCTLCCKTTQAHQNYPKNLKRKDKKARPKLWGLLFSASL